MDHRRHILPSSYQSHQLSLEDLSVLSGIRTSLSDSAGNAQLHNLASVGLYHDSKGLQSRVDRPMYSLPTVPSQPPPQSLGNTFEHRRQATRRRRHQRYSRNPIVDSPQYQAYRLRQNRDSNPEDAKWPEMLEIAFLDALVEIPPMGRRKFSFRGKPHGRNELIKEYIWIAYLQSLPPGVKPDESMQRTRKQVSSHIQVLKTFLTGHPAYARLFPGNKGPKNGFEDSFKNDPCLIALSNGHLPNKRYDLNDTSNHVAMNHNHASMKPVIFWLLITSSTLPDNINGKCDHEEDLYNAGIVVHKFTGLSGQRSRACVDTIPNWRHKFPRLEQLQLTGDLNCDVIHMEVSLNLMSAHPPEGAELYTRTELSIPGRKSDDCKLQWRIATSLTKPPELCPDSSLDPPLDGEEFIVDVLSSNEAETRIKLPFPAMAWAHAFTYLVNVQSRCEERRKAAQYGLDSSEAPKSARECVDQLSMYQEVRSSPNPKGPFARRAAILWTFRKAREGEASGTNWRYIDALPPRRTVMSQSPHASHRVSAAMNENFNSWVDPSMQLQHPNMLNSFVQDLATLPRTAGLTSPYATQGFVYSGLPFDLAGEELSFVSSNTVDSESTFVDGDSTASGLDNFLNGNHGLQLGEFEQQSNGWQFPHTASFDADPAWATYGVQSTTLQISWEPDIKTSPWSEAPDCKVMAWVDETTLKHDWAEASNSPTKQHSYVEQNIEQKLLPWIEHQSEEPKNGYSDAGVMEAAPFQ